MSLLIFCPSPLALFLHFSILILPRLIISCVPSFFSSIFIKLFIAFYGIITYFLGL
ncbi:hypothetical protein I79_008928 [Cricetulus griseus]|uniref:Uncharacterized protein n=1 Tax=Cricetulus griseus TaxID=10029 RepID=G3HEE5_CRIGR|nr:hypothetical protein I79_008928 [Cricetulus griseus]